MLHDQPRTHCIMQLPKRVLIRIARRLCERDSIALAATCKTGMMIVRQSAWSTCMRVRNLGRALKLDKDGTHKN